MNSDTDSVEEIVGATPGADFTQGEIEALIDERNKLASRVYNLEMEVVRLREQIQKRDEIIQHMNASDVKDQPMLESTLIF